MAFVASHGNWTVVCAFSSAYVLTRKNAALSPFKCIDLSADEANEKANEKANDAEKKKTTPVVKDIQALCCRFSRDGSLFAVATNRKKCLIFDGSTWTQLFSLDLPKAPTAVDFAIAHEKRLVVADRAGNVIHFPLKADVEPRSDAEDDEGTAIKHGGAMILGHLSMVLDVKLTADERFLLTTDRDEKVRVSNYPQAFVIHSFCLGHTQFVRSIVTWGDLIASAGGDGSIKFWTLDGQCISTIAADSDQPKAILKIDLAVHENVVRLAVALENSPTVRLLHLTRSGAEVAVQTSHSFEANDQVWDLGFADDALIVLTSNSNAPLMVLQRNSDVLEVCDVGADIGQSITHAKTELPPLKKVTSFNNVEAYQQRKTDRVMRKRKIN